MITADTFGAIEKEIKSFFPDVNVKNSMTPTGINLAFTTDSLNNDGLLDLAKVVTDNNLAINIKRSGTGLSIHLS